MSKRDYRSYNVLGEELAQQVVYENDDRTETQERDMKSTNEAKNIEQNISLDDVVHTTPLVNKPNKAIDTNDSIDNTEGEEISKSADISIYKSISTVMNGDTNQNMHQDIHQDINQGINDDVNEGVEKNIEKDLDNDVNKDTEKYTDKNINKNIDNSKDINSSKDINNNISMSNKINTHKDINKSVNKSINKDTNKYTSESTSMNEIQQKVDMTFSGYKNYYQTKERSKFVRWCLGLAKFILTIMLLPFIVILLGALVAFIGSVLTAIVISVGTGFVILGAICFMSTQVNASLIILGISIAVTAMSFGGILFILFLMLMKWSIGLFKKYKKPRNQSIKREER